MKAVLILSQFLKHPGKFSTSIPLEKIAQMKILKNLF